MKIEEKRSGIVGLLVTHPFPVILLLLLFSLSGIFLFRYLSIDLLPGLNYPLLNVITNYPGASPQDMEFLVTRPVEASVSASRDIRRISSVSSQGFSRVAVEFTWGTKIPQARQQVFSALARIQNNLPTGAVPVIENIGSSLQEIMGFSVKAKNGGLDQKELRNYAEYKIAPLLRSVKGISKIDIYGGEKEAYIVDIDPCALGDYNIGLSDIPGKIRSANIDAHVGFLNQRYTDFPLRGMSRIKSEKDLRKVLIRYSPPRKPLLLGKLSKIFTGTLPERYLVHTDGISGVAVSVYKQPDANTLKVIEAVKKKLKGIAAKNQAVKIKPYYDQAELIRNEVHSLVKSIILGAFLVTAVLIILLGDITGGIIIALTLPQIMSAALLFLYLSGFSLNMVTLGAFAAATGMIVDDSIIILENIYRRRQLIKNRVEASIKGTEDIMAPDISGTITTIAVFIPLLLTGGIAGKLSLPFGFIISTMLILSLVFSLTFIPALMAQRKDIRTGGNPFGDKFFAFLRGIMKKTLRKTLRYKKTSILLAMSVLAVSILLLFFSPIGLLPDIDEGAVLCEYILPPGTSFEESKRIAAEIDKIISKSPEVTSTYLRVGSAEGTYQTEGVNSGEIIAKLANIGKRTRSAADIIKEMKTRVSAIEGVITLFRQPTAEKIEESLSGLPAVFNITIYGDDYDELSEYARQIEKIAKKCPMVKDVVNNAVIKVPEIRIRLKINKINSFGLRPEKVLREIGIAMKGEVVTETIKNERQIPVFLISGKFPPARKNINDLKTLPIQIPGGGYINLSEIAEIEERYGINRLRHTYLRREITLTPEIEGNIGKAVKWLKKHISGSINIPPGYSIEFTGQYKSLRESAEGFLFAGIIAIMLVYLIMVIQFNSASQALIILIELPLAFTGGILALVITRQPLNIMSLIGFLTLIGISVNNGIILLDYTNKMRKGGMKTEDALEKSVDVRLRPIFLTSITAVLGLMPAALSSGILKSLAVVLAGGLTAGAFLTLNILPAIYCAIDRRIKKAPC